jgi:zinc transport system substrate-binding protein
VKLRFLLKISRKINLIILSLFFVFNAYPNTKKIKAFVTVAPQAGILKQIAENLIDVDVLVDASCPETFSPSAKQIKKLSDTDVYFKLSLPFEDSWIKKTSLSKDKVIQMGKGIKLRDVDNFKTLAKDLPCDCGKEHKHAHHHGSKDPHTWMSLKNSIKMAQNSYDVLIKLMPEHKKEFKKNLEDYKKRLNNLDSKLKKRFKAQKNKNLFVFHPVFGYFADDYGLKQIPIQVEGKEPSAKQLTQIIDIIKNENAEIIFTQPEFSDKTAKAIAKQSNAKTLAISIYDEDITLTIKELLDKWDTK